MANLNRTVTTTETIPFRKVCPNAEKRNHPPPHAFPPRPPSGPDRGLSGPESTFPRHDRAISRKPPKTDWTSGANLVWHRQDRSNSPTQFDPRRTRSCFLDSLSCSTTSTCSAATFSASISASDTPPHLKPAWPPSSPAMRVFAFPECGRPRNAPRANAISANRRRTIPDATAANPRPVRIRSSRRTPARPPRPRRRSANSAPRCRRPRPACRSG